jgi:DMSO/TMAO reductase YedYZ molybdopterin-dependent catalytic subunit
VTPNDRFYTVTKNILDPTIARPVWRLAVTGQVARPRTYTFAELTALPASEQEATLSCISNDVGDGLSSNARWTGVPLRQLLETAGPQGNIARVVCYGADNYVDTIPLDKALDPTTFVAWAMNGAPLPQRHGYPVRIVVPGRFGEKSVKWVTRIELAAEDVKGFYERQGWGPTFVTQTFSRFDLPHDGQAIALAGAAPFTIQGIAFAGDRGITRVEISTDDGHTWQNAQLDYQPSRIAWAFWSLAWRPTQPGEYRLAVRAVDGAGTYQTSDRRGITPDGATGYHRITVRVTA